MGDVVVKLPLRYGEEAIRFGEYLTRFLNRCAEDVRLLSQDTAPVLIVQSEPQGDLVVKVLTFQERRIAEAFSLGWAQTLPALTAA